MDKVSHNTEIELRLKAFEATLLDNDVHELLDGVEALDFLECEIPEVYALRGFHEGFSGVHKDLWTHTLKVIQAMPQRLELRWAALLHDVGKVPTRELKEGNKVTFWHHEKVGGQIARAIGDRLGWSKEKTTHIAFIVEHHGRFNAYQESWTDKAIRRLIRDAGPYLDDLMTFSSGDLTTENPKKARRAKRQDASLRQRIKSLSAPSRKLPRGMGDRVIEAFNIKRGPEVRAAMDWLQEEVSAERLAPDLEFDQYIDALRDSQEHWYARPSSKDCS
tara:strand:- start:1836 stop:2663 length:828 start_codon:yes stop_codon:yes gene_type:complete